MQRPEKKQQRYFNYYYYYYIDKNKSFIFISPCLFITILIIQVSVISNETSEEKETKKAINKTINSKDKNAKELKETTKKIEKNGSEDESLPLNITKSATKSNPKIDFDYEKFMKELKESHNKLSKLNEALKMNKKTVQIVSTGIIKFYQVISFRIFNTFNIISRPLEYSFKNVENYKYR